MTMQKMDAEAQIDMRIAVVKNLMDLIDQIAGQTNLSKASASIMLVLAIGDIMEQIGGESFMRVVERSAFPRFEKDGPRVANQERKFMLACEIFYRQADLRAAKAEGPMQ
jgi:hypothetical protein